jgi:hypothetical protein
VKVKTVSDFPGGRRFSGVVTASDAATVTIALDEPVGESITFDFVDIEKAQTVFVWAAAPKPGGPKSKPDQKPGTGTKAASGAAPKQKKVTS